MMLVPLILVAIILLLIARSPSSTPGQSVSHAQEILDQRLAAGEVSSEEYARRSGTLAEARVGAPRRQTALIVGGVTVVALLLAATMWGGMGRGWPEFDGWMGGHMGWNTIDGSADAPVPGAATIEIVATDLRFDPSTATITAGVPVNLTLVNDGRAFHDLTIPALGFMLDAAAGQQASGSLRVDEPGTYEFLCSVPGHAAAGMRGSLIVQATSS